MKLPWSKAESTDTDVADEPATPTAPSAAGSSTTAGKGRPTPRRRDAEKKRRGPVAAAPQNRTEARARRRELRKSTTPADRKLASKDRREARVEQRQKMMAGDERYLLPRDKGHVRRYTRDIVDSRRNFAGLFMPFAIILIVIILVPQVAVYSTLLMLVFAVFLVIDAFILGRLVNKRVRERFPDTSEKRVSLGFYAFNRSMQMRFMRAPKPQVSPGDAV